MTEPREAQARAEAERRRWLEARRAGRAERRRRRRAPLEGKVIAVTGAASGIGRQLALGLARRGARLALTDLDAEGLAATKRMLGNREVQTSAFDVTDRAALAAFIDGAATDYGVLHGIINNAGLSKVAPFADMPREAFDRVMAVNFDAVVEGTRAALPHLRAAGEGWIVNISSVFGMIGYPTQSAYNASKYAVRGFTEALHLELSRTDPALCAIRVHPGGVGTNVARNAEVIAHMPGHDLTLDSAAEFEKSVRTSAADAAETILRGMEQRRHRVLVGADARMVDRVARVFPTSYWRWLRLFADRPAGN